MISFATYDSPVGFIEIGCEDLAVVSLRRVETPVYHDFTPASNLANLQLQEYFKGSRKTFDLPIRLHGTAFQTAVWECIQKIPYGQVLTYGQIATMIGKPKASQAVGQAAGKNPVWIIIPCHRVVGVHQALTGYAGGLEMKQALLKLEKEHA